MRPAHSTVKDAISLGNSGLDGFRERLDEQCTLYFVSINQWGHLMSSALKYAVKFGLSHNSHQADTTKIPICYI